MDIVTIEGLNKSFANVQALSDVSLGVRQGTIMGLLGPNGAGKTTLLRIINGIISSDSGTVSIMGEPASLDAARRIGYMPEERGLYDKMTVSEQIIFFGRLKGAQERDIRKTMKEYIDMFNLEGQENRKIKELSKGNQQKVQIIATLAHEPELVILDEPFSGFDPINSQILTDLVARLQNRGTTIILSSHNMHAVEEMCSDIALIDHGHLLLHGSIADIKDRNRDDSILVTTVSPIDSELLLSSDLISDIKQIPNPGWRKGYSYKMKKLPKVSNTSVIPKIAEQSEISLFEEALPSLNDIFLKYTTSQN